LKAFKSGSLFSFPSCSHSRKLCPVDTLWDNTKCKCILQEENPLAGTEGNNSSSEIIIVIIRITAIAVHIIEYLLLPGITVIFYM
jgi:hypothetical protein